MHKNATDTSTSTQHSSILSLVWKIFIPIAIGLGVVAWLFRSEFNPEVLSSIRFNGRVIGCIVVAWLFMIGRDFGLTCRFRLLADGRLSWKKALKVDMMCEFTSCVTPSAVGGSAFGMIYLNSEGIELGRATALMMTTLFLDELFYVISLPIVMLLVPYHSLFAFGNGGFTVGLQSVFWSVYALTVGWTVLLFIGIFIKPHAIHRFLNRIFRMRLLRRWAEKIDNLGNDMEITGCELRQWPLHHWCKAFAATILSWTSRYLVVNALFFGFAPAADQLVVFARQFVVWICLTVSPTSGSAGISEWLFTTYYGDLINSTSMVLVIAMFWRVISYYIYLIAGACIMPGWIRRSLRRRNSVKLSATATSLPSDSKTS